MYLDKFTHPVIDVLQKHGARPYLVGGYVRDAFLNIPSKDIDIEVHGVSQTDLEKILEPFKVDKVGKSFGVYKLGNALDISLPRRESKMGEGHKGFEISFDPTITLEEALARRDFTINAIAYDILNKQIIDPFHGVQHLTDRVLLHTSDHFKEDPLRVLRGMQFIARFNLSAHPDLVEICQDMSMEGLSKDRVWEEWKKLFFKGTSFSNALSFLRITGWDKYFPELEALQTCEQEPAVHPEGSVWNHTLHALDSFGRNKTNDENDLVVGLAVLCHDLGKTITTKLDANGFLSAKGHAEAGVSLTHDLLRRMTEQEELIKEVSQYVSQHMAPWNLYAAKAPDSAIRRLSLKVKSMKNLLRVCRADQEGRPGLPISFEEITWTEEAIKRLDVLDSAPKPLVMGRHLLEMGVPPGKRVGEIIHQCFEAQLEGKFFTLEEGLQFAKNIIDKESISEN